MLCAKKGFTLIELLVVVLIIGILASVAFPQYQIAIGVSRVSKVISFAKVINDAQERYRLATGDYSTVFGSFDVSMPEGGTINSTGTTVTYSDFYCFLRTASTGSSVYCNVKSPVGINMEKYYNGKFICWPKTNDITDLTNRICQKVSGRDIPTGQTSTGQRGYVF